MMYVIKLTDLNEAKKALIALKKDVTKIVKQAQKEGKTLDSDAKIKDDLKKGK